MMTSCCAISALFRFHVEHYPRRVLRIRLDPHHTPAATQWRDGECRCARRGWLALSRFLAIERPKALPWPFVSGSSRAVDLHHEVIALPELKMPEIFHRAGQQPQREIVLDVLWFRV